MMMKCCTGCNIKKSAGAFYKERRAKDGFTSACKHCMLKKQRERYAQDEEFRQRCIERSKNQVVPNEYYRNYVSQNLTKIKEYRKEYYQRNKEKDNLSSRRWRLNNRERINERERHSLKTNVQHKLRKTLRNRMLQAVKKNYRAGSAVRDLGCSVEFFKDYLEKQFQPGMSWNNHGRTGWHIDHIKPLVNFDLTDREQFLEACHYTNQRPLWMEENLCRKKRG